MRASRRTRRIALMCALLLPSLAAGGASAASGSPADTHAAGVPPSATRPNIVLVLTDDQTLDTAHMPYLSSRTDWIDFPNAFENVALCCPSRATLLTGQYDTHSGVINNTPPGDGQSLDETNTLPVWLQAAGYDTALVGKYLNGYPWSRGRYVPPGWDHWASFLTYPSYYNYTLLQDHTAVTHGAAAPDYSTNVLAGLASDFISTATPPFFLEYTPHTPHSPFTVAPDHVGAFAGEPVPHDANFNETDVSDKPVFLRELAPLSPVVMDNQRRKTWAMMLSVDDALRRFDETLAATGQLDNTVEIFMTDNGFAFGEHRWNKKRCEYDVCLRTPLLVRMPGRPAARIPELVQNIDIASTIAELAGATPGRPQDGTSLVPLLNGTATTWRHALLQHWGGGGPVGRGNPPNFWAIRTDKYRYVELVTGEKELYDYSTDPQELQNLDGEPAHAGVESQLAAELAAMRTAAGGDRPGVDTSSPSQKYVEEG